LNALEVGLSGMSLLSKLENVGGSVNGSQLSSSPQPESSEHSLSGNSPKPATSTTAAPPGLQLPVIKPAEMSPSLTLTPNSSVDGTASADWNSVTHKHSSPFSHASEPPALPFLQQQQQQQQNQHQQHSRQSSSTSLESTGLFPPRERSHSSPGFISSSPPLAHHGRVQRPPRHVQAPLVPQEEYGFGAIARPPTDMERAASYDPSAFLQRPRHVRSVSAQYPQQYQQPHQPLYSSSRHSFHGGAPQLQQQPPPATGYRAGPYENRFKQQQQQQQYYYSDSSYHSRQPSDAAVSLLSNTSPPVSVGSRDDDVHPLMGEHIEVPDSEEYLPNFRRHGHSLSMDAYGAPPVAEHKVVYAVKFKRTQRNFVLGPRLSRDLKIGTYVKVEADRGEDLGIVVGKLGNPYGRASDLKRITRLATHDEVSLLSMKRDEEDDLLQICRQKVSQRALPMNVVDAEYQFDRHKLTFFFEAEGRVDFRELVRDLFSMYKTRIWMQQLDKSSQCPAMVQPVQPLSMDYGTPIIAPVSEFADSIVGGPP